MVTSKRARKMLTEFEGLRLVPYNCPAGYATVGVGHLIARRPVTLEDKPITREVADTLLAMDLRRFERAVPAATQNQFDAMVLLAFNIGAGAFSRSSVLRKFKAGDLMGAADAFLLWNKAGGRVLPGLVRRREAERALFLGGAKCQNE